MIVDENFKTAIFVDGQNMYSAMQKLGWKIDFGKLLEYFQGGSALIRPYYYTMITQEADNPLRTMLDYLDFSGWRVTGKRLRSFTDAGGVERYRGSFDIEMVVEMMKIAPHVDNIVIFSGDGDLVPVIVALQDAGKVVTIISTVKTSPPFISTELRRQCDYFFDLEDYRSEIERL